jgi:DNA-binding MarR family transcriptional regulator
MPEQSIDPTLTQTIDQFWDSVPRVWHIIRGHIRTIAAEQFGISVEQFHVLRFIRKGLTSVKDIAEARQISRPAISQAAELLVAKGLITRREAAGDRRFVHLALTPAGEALLDDIFAQNRAWMQTKMASLSLQDLALITEGLARLISTFDSPAE